jgi:hypothetical protein
LHYRHAKVLERELKNSKLVTLNGTGHELHYSDWDIIIDAISKEYLNEGKQLSINR